MNMFKKENVEKKISKKTCTVKIENIERSVRRSVHAFEVLLERFR